MEHSVGMYRIHQRISDEQQQTLSKMGPSDLCFFRYVGGDVTDTEELMDHLGQLRATGATLVGIFRFPFRFEGRRRTEAAVRQYYVMRDMCDGVTYVTSDGMMADLPPEMPFHEAKRRFSSVEEGLVNAMEHLIRTPGDMNIDARDVKTFFNESQGPVFVRMFGGDIFDEPLKYILSASYLPQDYADGSQLIIHLGYGQQVDLMTFQQINLRLGDLFHKADLFKMGTYALDDPGRTVRITVLVGGLHDPIPRPADIPHVSTLKYWWKRKLAAIAAKAPVEEPNLPDRLMPLLPNSKRALR